MLTSMFLEKLNLTIKNLKNKKVTGLNNILREQIKHFRQNAKKWLHDFFREIVNTYHTTLPTKLTLN